MKEDNFVYTKEIIGNLIEDSLPREDPESDEPIELINRLLNLAEDSYVLINWPESQDYMEEEWFNEEALLSEESSYFVPLKRILNNN